MKDKRAYYFIIFIICSFLLVVLRLIDLQILRHGFFIDKALEQRQRIIPLAASRGDIYERNGRLLATSVDSFSIYVNPKEFTDYDKLSKLLDVKFGPFSQKRVFAWVKRKVDADLCEKIKKMEIKGVYFLPEKKRIYPKERFASQVLGFVGMDNEGLSGIELGLDDYLKGESSSIVAESDPAGYELLTRRQNRAKKNQVGMDVYLTIDETIQYVAERELEKTVKQFSANSGIIIVMDAKNGEILALAGKPDFNPNLYRKFNPKTWKCRAIDIYEPGSTFKTITMASGFDTKVIDMDSKLKPMDKLEIGGRIIENSHKIQWKGSFVSIPFMLEQSINTAVAQIGMKMGKNIFYKKIRDFGFGDPIGVGFYGESRGIVKDPAYWYEPDIAMMTFGQSIAITPLQLCAAYASFANDGMLIKPQLIKRIENEDQSFIKTSRREEVKKSISKKAAEDTMKVLESVVIHGSGKKAKMLDYRVGGKTGTAQKAIEGGRGYMKGHYIASFIGIAPLKDPKIVALVLVDDPKGVIWGETVCGPTFKVVVENALRYLNVKPDVL